MHFAARYAAALSILMLVGAGCFAPVASPNVAVILDNRLSDSLVTQKMGFGTLPQISQPINHVHVTLTAPLPQLQTEITVIRLRRGTPNESELQNIAAAVGIPGGALGDLPTQSALNLAWTDPSGYQWTYRAEDRVLAFSSSRLAPASPLTVSQLPSNTELTNLANAFLVNRGIDSQLYRNALINPDWNTWWYRAKVAGMCMDISTLQTVRAIGASDPLVANGPPALPLAASTTCVLPEFPNKAVVQYNAFIDQRDVVQADGSFVPGIEIAIDVAKKTITGGRISLFSNPDRSDYPSITPDQALALLQSGGITPISGESTITALEFASYRLDKTEDGRHTIYLIPSLVGSGFRSLADGTQEPIRIVVPLLRQ